MPKPPDLKRLRKLIGYDAESGILFWRKPRKDKGGRSKFGSIAGSLKPPRASIRIGLDGITYNAQDLAWFHHYGEWPDCGVGHLDGVRTNNAIKNLRRITKKGNLHAL